jgi:hypothetical protein
VERLCVGTIRFVIRTFILLRRRLIRGYIGETVSKSCVKGLLLNFTLRTIVCLGARECRLQMYEESTYCGAVQCTLLTLIMEAVRTSETSVYFNETTWRYISE